MRRMWLCALFALLCLWIRPAAAATPEGGVKTGVGDPSAVVPKDRIVTVEDLYGKWLEIRDGKSKAVLLDVRTPKEYESGHVPGSKNVPSDRPARVREYWPDPDTEIWVYCRTQRRSMEFASFLYRHGYRNVSVMEGGILAWTEKGYPLSKSR